MNGLNFNVSKEISFCESCTEGKHHRSQFPTSGAKRSEEVLGLVHTDVCGKINVKSLSGGEYFLTFIDDKTRYVWVYILKRKDQVFEKFREWKALVENSIGQKLKALRSDNGGEYTSIEFEKYLKTEGVRHELTVPKTPEQNGVSERMNRTLVESVRSMLSDAKLPHSYWAEALSTAAYVRNRSPTKAVQDMTPFEALTGEKPDVKHLRAFGCTAYAHVAKDERHKLDSKTRKCIFLGYGTETKGYRLYEPKRAKVFYSRDVVFNESSRHEVERELDNQEESHVELDYEDGEDNEDVTIENEVPVQDQVPRRSTRERRRPEYYVERASSATSNSWNEPANLQEALASDDKEKWKEATVKEMESLNTNDVWDLVELPENRKAVGSKWGLKVKTDANGSVERYKARLVAQGFSQKYGSISCNSGSGSSKWFEATSTRRNYSFSQWRSEGRSLHEATRRLCCQGTRALGMQTEA